MTSRPRLRPAAAATMRQHVPRLYDGARILATARVVAHYAGRDRRLVERHCTPVACDAASGLALYDLDDALATLAPRRRQATRNETPTGT